MRPNHHILVSIFLFFLYSAKSAAFCRLYSSLPYFSFNRKRWFALRMRAASRFSSSVFLFGCINSSF